MSLLYKCYTENVSAVRVQVSASRTFCTSTNSFYVGHLSQSSRAQSSSRSNACLKARYVAGPFSSISTCCVLVDVASRTFFGATALPNPALSTSDDQRPTLDLSHHSLSTPHTTSHIPPHTRPTSLTMSAPRSLLRFLGTSPLLTRAQVSRNIARNVRTQSTAATAEGQSAAVKFWNSPVGPKTVHFWAPIMKVCSVMGR